MAAAAPGSDNKEERSHCGDPMNRIYPRLAPLPVLAATKSLRLAS
jgi:hypothetical protein